MEGLFESNAKNHSLTSELNIIHDELNEHLNIEGKTKQASTIETYLNACVKDLQEAENAASNSQSTSALANQIYTTFKQEYENAAKKLGINIRGYTVTKMRRHYENTKFVKALTLEKGKEIDDIGEFFLQTLFKSASQNINNTQSNIILTHGTDTANIKNYEQVQNSLNNLFTADADKIQGTELEFRSGKIDMAIADNIITADITGQINNDNFTKLLSAIQGHTFTVKNYLLSTINDSGLGLGNTSDIKSIIAPIQALGASVEQAAHIYFHQYYTKQAKNAVLTHIPHLQAYYELTGAGLIDDKGNPLNIAEFLIVQVNDNMNTNKSWFKVYSTEAIIKDFINPKKSNYQFKSGHLHGLNLNLTT